MITLTGGQFQDANGNLLKSGFLALQLNQDAAIIAGGQVLRAIPVYFPITNGSISSSAKIYSNAELTPQTQYFVYVTNTSQKRIGDAAVWQFSQAAGATVDIGTMVPVSGGVVFANPVVLSPTAVQKILNFALELQKTLILDGSTSGSTILQASATASGTATLPAASGVLALLSLAQNWTALQEFSAGISGNGTNVLTLPNLTDVLAVLGTAQNFTALQRFSGGISVNGTNTLTLPAATDTLAAIAAAQTLTNKILQGAGSGNAVTLLNSQDTLGNLTGNGTDQTVYTFTIPANTIQAGKGIRLRFHALNNNAAVVTYKVKLGTTTLVTAPTSAASNNNTLQLEVFNNAGVQNAQRFIGFGFDGTAILMNSTGTVAENTANALALTVTANEANPNTITPDKWIVELIQ